MTDEQNAAYVISQIRSLQAELEEANRHIDKYNASIIELQSDLEAERKAHDDLKRSVLDGSHQNLVLERKAREQLSEALKQSNANYDEIDELYRAAVNMSEGHRERAEAAEAKLATARAEVIKECADELLLEDWQEASHIVRALNEPAADTGGQTQSLGENEVPSEQPAPAAALPLYGDFGGYPDGSYALPAAATTEQAGEMAVRLADEAEAAYKDEALRLDEYKPEKGNWVLVSPSGKLVEGDSLLECVRKEGEARIPATVRLARIKAACEPTPEDLAEQEALRLEGMEIAAKICDKQRNPQHKEWANWGMANCSAAIRAEITRRKK